MTLQISSLKVGRGKPCLQAAVAQGCETLRDMRRAERLPCTERQSLEVKIRLVAVRVAGAAVSSALGKRDDA